MLALSILVCKVLYFIGSRAGKGSSFPGRVSLALCPNALKRIRLPEIVIAVTGSNGKTSTVEMIAHALKAGGMSVGWNREGANQIEGVATLILRTAALNGAVKHEALVLECDERFAKKIFENVRPTVIVLTNLCRDQMTRNGHPEFIQDCLRKAIDVVSSDVVSSDAESSDVVLPDVISSGMVCLTGKTVTLVLNADDPYVTSLAPRLWHAGCGLNESASGAYADQDTASGADYCQSESNEANTDQDTSSGAVICRYFGISKAASPESRASRASRTSNSPAGAGDMYDSSGDMYDSAGGMYDSSGDMYDSSGDMYDSAGGMYDDGAFCPVCKGRLVYDYRVAGHMGAYRCETCGLNRPKPEIEAEELDTVTGEVTLAGGIKTRLAFPGLTGAYNLIAAITAVSAAGKKPEDAAKALDRFELTGGRTPRFSVGERNGLLLISKHENSLSYDQSLKWILERQTPCTVVVMVDSISRKYYTSETSWLWDIDFGILANDHINNIVLTGRYTNELAARFAMTAIEPGRIACAADPAKLREHIERETSGDIFALTCFADKEKLLSLFI